MTQKIEYELIKSDDSVSAYFGDKKIGELDFIFENPAVMVITRTWTDPEFRGNGIGAELTRYIVEYARKNGKQIIPQCSFAAAFFKNNSDFQDVEYK